MLPVTTTWASPSRIGSTHAVRRARQIALKIYGEGLDTLRRLAEEFRGKLAGVAGVVDLQVEKQVRIPQLEITVDYERAALYGLQPAAITEALERLSNGRVVSRLIDGNRRFDVVMRLPDALRTTQALGDMLIETPLGWVPVRQLAGRGRDRWSNQILRENGKRRIVVLANSDGRTDMARIVTDIRGLVAASQLPQGYFTSFEGTFQAQEEATRTIGILSAISLAMVFAILYSRYRSVLFASSSWARCRLR